MTQAGANNPSEWKLAANPFASGLQASEAEPVEQEEDVEMSLAEASQEEAAAPKEASNKHCNPACGVVENKATVDNADPMELDDDETEGDVDDETEEDVSVDDLLSNFTVKLKRSVSPTPYIPMFPNLPSGRDWFARQVASGNSVPDLALIPLEQHVPATGMSEKKAAVAPKEASKKQRVPDSEKKVAAAPEQAAVPERRSERIKAAAPVDKQVPVPGPFESGIKSSGAANAVIPGAGLAALRQDLPAEDYSKSTMQPWMLPNVDKPHTVQIVQTSSAAAMEPNFNTTPFTPAVTPYEKPKATLLFKRPDGTFEKIKEPTGPIRALGIGPDGRLYVKGVEKKEQDDSPGYEKAFGKKVKKQNAGECAAKAKEGEEGPVSGEPSK